MNVLSRFDTLTVMSSWSSIKSAYYGIWNRYSLRLMSTFIGSKSLSSRKYGEKFGEYDTIIGTGIIVKFI